MPSPEKEQPKPTYSELEKKDSAACFWVAAKHFMGLYAITNYWELKN
jgi:hypothetical protein